MGTHPTMEDMVEEDMGIVKNCSELEGDCWILLTFMTRFSLDLEI
jgi:hypothetical protein